MTRARALAIGVIVVAAVAVTAIVAVLVVGSPNGGMAATRSAAAKSSTGVPKAPSTQSTAALEQAFLSGWVSDGRVIRRDQGGDTVSEGQSYGMLIAYAAGNTNDFRQIWSWTKTHLQQPNGLLAWRWQNGAVVDDRPASDGDLETARALVLAGQNWHVPAYTTAGKALASAILSQLTSQTADGLILRPGTWTTTDPYQYDASYASPGAFAVLARATGDARWNQLEAGSAAVLAKLEATSPLPPDWSQVHVAGAVDDMPGPNGTGPSVRYSYDAARIPIWYAQSCTATDRAMSASLAHTLDERTPLAASLDLGANPLAASQHPVAYIGRAAARAAAGDQSGARADLKRADALERRSPSYYGAAWTAMAPVLLESNTLGGCAVLKGSAA